MPYYDHFHREDTQAGLPAEQSRSIVAKLRRSNWLVWLTLVILLIGIETALQSHAANPCEAQPSDQIDMQTLASWINSLQYTDPALQSFGAIKIHYSPGFCGYDCYYRVAPYHANLAVVGLLRAPVLGKLEVTENWIQWQLNHVVTSSYIYPGVVVDHWYRARGDGETTCLDPRDSRLCDYSDSHGSFAATFLGVAWEYYNAGGSAAFLNVPGNKEIFERIGGVILGLQQEDGLVSENSSSVKYLMDNSEVYWGLKSMEALEARIFNDRTASQMYARAAAQVQNGIRYSLYDPDTGLYRVAVHDGGYWNADLSNWYPGTVSLLWPSLFSVTQGNSKIARTQISALNSTWNGAVEPDWTTYLVDPDGFPWASIGYTALLAGDCGRARAHLRLVKAEKFPSASKKPGFDWPFPVDDAGWLLRTLSQISQPNRTN